MKKTNRKKLTALGFNRLKTASAEAYAERAKQIQTKLLAGEYRGDKVRAAKKMFAFCKWKSRQLSGVDKKAAKNIAQLIFPQILREMGVIPMDDLFLRQTLKEASKLAKKIKKRKVA